MTLHFLNDVTFIFIKKFPKLNLHIRKKLDPFQFKYLFSPGTKKNLYLQYDLQTIRERRDNKQIQGLDVGDAAALC